MLLPREIRRKLRELARGERPAGRSSAAEEAAEPEPLPGPGDAKPAPGSWRPPVGPPVRLEDLLPGEAEGNDYGELYVVRRRETEISAHASSADDLVSVLRRPDLAGVHDEFAALVGASPERIAFLDTETAGLQSAPLFLCGIMRYSRGAFVVEQFLARDYAEEPALLEHIRVAMERSGVLVTYNGRTFDVPFINERMVYHLLDYQLGGPHIDLLPHARRRYRGTLPDCKLQTLEAHVCRRARSIADIPGEEIPQAYHDFVATGDARLIEPVFAHNALDLITLADILVRITQ